MNQCQIAQRLIQALGKLEEEDLDLIEAMAVRLARRRASMPEPQPSEEGPLGPQG